MGDKLIPVIGLILLVPVTVYVGWLAMRDSLRRGKGN